MNFSFIKNAQLILVFFLKGSIENTIMGHVNSKKRWATIAKFQWEHYEQCVHFKRGAYYSQVFKRNILSLVWFENLPTIDKEFIETFWASAIEKECLQSHY
jgi:hypothetical protein